MSNPNPFNEHDSMSEAQLDELLDLAKPKLDPTRQKSLRRTVGQALKSSRPGWWRLFQSNALGSRRPVISVLVVSCCLLVLAGLGWLATPSSKRTAPAAVAGTSKSDALPKPLTLSGSELAKLYPPIISRNHAKARSNTAGANNAIRQETAQKHVHDLLNSLPAGIETSLLTIAGTDVGLMLVEEFTDGLDEAAANNATNRAALLNSRVRRSKRVQDLRQLEQQDQHLRFTRLQVESYLANAVERLPKQQATSAFRILCRVGSQSSLPLILKYRNVEVTRADAALAISKLADARLLAQLILETNDADVQSQLMAGLLCRHDPDSLDLFLELTAKHDLYSAAQKSGCIAHCVPIEILMQRLRSNRARIARAAAITMSGMNDPNITEYLMQLANRPESYRSAVMALTARTDDSAVRFVQLASSDVRWSATVINEKRKWNRILVLN